MYIIKNNTTLFFISMVLRDQIKIPPNIQLPVEWEECLERLRVDGLCVAPFLMSEEVISGAIQFIEDNLGDAQQYGSDYRLFDSNLNSQVISQKFAGDRRIIDIGKRYLRSNIILQTTLASKLTYQKGNLGSGQGWHRDSYSHQYKSIVYLNDVDDDTGPFQYLIGSQRYGQIWRELTYKSKIKKRPVDPRYSAEEMISLKASLGLKSTKVLGPRGTIILVDSRGLHRGTPIVQGDRYALTNYFIQKSHHNKNEKI